jgi:hypothetical protein
MGPIINMSGHGAMGELMVFAFIVGIGVSLFWMVVD